MITKGNYQNDPSRRHNRDGQDEQTEVVRSILDNMRLNERTKLVVKEARSTVRWNACLQQYVEVR